MEHNYASVLFDTMKNDKYLDNLMQCISDMRRIRVNSCIMSDEAANCFIHGLQNQMSQSAAFLRFLDVVFRNNKKRYILLILYSFLQIVSIELKIYEAQISISKQQDEKYIDEIVAALMEKYECKIINYHVVITPEISSGFVVRMNNLIIDCSMRTMLRKWIND